MKLKTKFKRNIKNEFIKQNLNESEDKIQTKFKTKFKWNIENEFENKIH
jgi:hypothetical protein